MNERSGRGRTLVVVGALALAVAAAGAGGRPVIAVGQHEDVDLRKRALAAGATRVFSYNKFFTDGPTLVAEWLLRSGAVAPR